MLNNLEQFTRFKDAPWFPTPENRPTVTIGGAGGIGSWLALFLSRAGFRIDQYDFDFVEPHNLGGQAFFTQDTGKLKIEAVREVIFTFCEEEYYCGFSTPIVNGTPVTPFCFSAFDNMEARKNLLLSWIQGPVNDWYTNAQNGYSLYNRNNPMPIFIDGRLEAEQLQIFCVTPENSQQYFENHIFPDSNVPELSCTFKQTTHSAAMIASHMMAIFTNHITNINAGESVREVPFKYEFVIPFNYTVE